MVIFAKVYYQIEFIKNRFLMKKLLFLFLLVPMKIWAQDVIVKKDGTTILAKVNKVGTKEIEFKKWKNRNGPTYTISVEDVLSINYQNGEKDLFDSSLSNAPTQKSSNNNSPKNIKKKASANNNQLINRYRTDIRQKGTPLGEDATYCNVYFGVTSSSIISNEDLDISFTQNDDGINCSSFDIEITNKTNRVLYIDKGNCFRVINNFNYTYCYYNATEQTTISKSTNGGVSLGLGSIAGHMGIGGIAGQLASDARIGGGTSKTASTTYSSQRVIAIPPKRSQKLCDNRTINLTGNRRKTIDPNEDFRTYKYGNNMDWSWTSYDIFAHIFHLYKGDLKVGQVLSFTEGETPYRRNYYLTYSLSENFDNYTTLEFSVYLQQAVGKKHYSTDNIDTSKTDLVILCRDAKLNKK